MGSKCICCISQMYSRKREIRWWRQKVFRNGKIVNALYFSLLALNLDEVIFINLDSKKTVQICLNRSRYGLKTVKNCNRQKCQLREKKIVVRLIFKFLMNRIKSEVLIFQPLFRFHCLSISLSNSFVSSTGGLISKSAVRKTIKSSKWYFNLEIIGFRQTFFVHLMEYTDIDIVGKETHRQQMAFGDVLIPRFVTVLIYLRFFGFLNIRLRNFDRVFALAMTENE